MSGFTEAGSACMGTEGLLARVAAGGEDGTPHIAPVGFYAIDVTGMGDATFALWGQYALGFDHEASSFFHFIAEAAGEDGGLQPMYGIGGEQQLDGSVLGHLSGYRRTRPVLRIGNAAHRQDQHDVSGSLLDSVYLHAKSRDHLPEFAWPLLKRPVEAAIDHWHQPDHGIWEIRGQPSTSPRPS